MTRGTMLSKIVASCLALMTLFLPMWHVVIVRELKVARHKRDPIIHNHGPVFIAIRAPYIKHRSIPIDLQELLLFLRWESGHHGFTHMLDRLPMFLFNSKQCIETLAFLHLP